jgi:hypothetical protein
MLAWQPAPGRRRQQGEQAPGEWFAHMPHATDRAELYDMVATAPCAPGQGQAAAAVVSNPRRHLYGIQLRQIFHRLVARNPSRPVVRGAIAHSGSSLVDCMEAARWC